jgi:hypothetical protein
MKKVDWAWVTIIGCAVLYVLNICLSTGIYDTSDGLMHYSITRFAPKHPELFLDHWGKPLFTTLAAPFAQFGIKGVVLLNILLFVLTARALVSILHTYRLPHAAMAPLFLASVPVYYQTVMSGLTEVLFAAVAIISLWAFAKQRFWLTALLVGFLPFARSEAYFLVPLFAALLLLRKQWLALLLIAVAPFVMSLIGWHIFDDFWWIINNNPYTGARDIYGQGDLGHFVKNGNSIFGLGLSIFIIPGFFYLPWALANGRQSKNQVYGLAFAASVSVIAAHSVFWWKGLYGSLGLFRVLATIVPYALVVGWFAYGALAKKFIRPILPAAVLFLLVVLNIHSLWVFQPIAKKTSNYEELAIELRNWYQQSPYANNPNVWFMHPVIGYYLNIDLFEKLDSRKFWHLNKIKPSNSVRENGLIIYDEAHSPNEGAVSKERLFADSDLTLVYRDSLRVGEAQNVTHASKVLVFAKKSDASKDTLVFEDFNAYRPILEGRLNRIHTDSLERRYLDMVTITHYMPVYTFWRVDSAIWNAPAYRFWFDGEPGLEVWLSVVATNGLEKDVRWKQGDFTLPKMEEDIANISISLRNPAKEKALRVYEWGLVKLDSDRVNLEAELK